MPSMPLGFFIALIAALLVMLAGLLGEKLAIRHRARGYPEIAAVVRGLATALNGEVDRDGNDLLLRVNVQQWPVLVRFSNADGQPGLNVRTPVEAKLAFYCVPRGKYDAPHPEALPTRDPHFDSRFRITSSEPFMGNLLLKSESVVSTLQRLCCSSKTFLSMEDKYLELSELTIPQGDVALHVGEHISDMAKLAHITRSVAGTSALHIKPYRKSPNWFRMVYGSLAIVLIGVALWLGRPAGPVQAAPAPVAETKAAIPPADAALIPNLSSWRLLEPADCNVSALAYLQQQGLHPEGRITADFSGQGGDSAYVFINNESGGQPVRVVMLVKQQVRFDAGMARLDVAARIPKSSIAGIEWKNRAPLGGPDGDGLLLVRDYSDPGSATVLYWSGVRLMLASPKDFHMVALQ
jgi:hypothetical protein